jgi:HlyD family secretion protein
MRHFLLGVIALVCFSLSACSKQDNNVVQGYIEGDLVYLAPSQSGHLLKLSAHRGDSVKAGAALFSLDLQPESDSLAQATATLQQAKATLKDMQLGERPDAINEILANIAMTQSSIDFYSKQEKRYEKLTQKSYGSQEDYDKNKNKHDMAVAKKANLEASLALAKLGGRDNQLKAQEQVVAANSASVAHATWQVSQKTQNAPTAGVIYDTYYAEGEWVPAGGAVASILSPKDIHVIFFIPETRLATVHVGDKMDVHCDSCKAVQAIVNYISNENEYTPPVIFSEDMREKLVYEVRASLPLDKALSYHPGQPVDVTLPAVNA